MDSKLLENCEIMSLMSRSRYRTKMTSKRPKVRSSQGVLQQIAIAPTDVISKIRFEMTSSARCLSDNSTNPTPFCLYFSCTDIPSKPSVPLYDFRLISCQDFAGPKISTLSSSLSNIKNFVLRLSQLVPQ